MQVTEGVPEAAVEGPEKSMLSSQHSKPFLKDVGWFGYILKVQQPLLDKKIIKSSKISRTGGKAQ